MIETVGHDRSIDMSRAREYVKAIAVSGFTAMNVQRPNYRNDEYYPNIAPVVKFCNTYAARAVAFLKVEAEVDGCG